MALKHALPAGLRPRLILLIAFTVSASMALLFANALQQRRSALEGATAEAQLLSRLAAAHEERSVGVAREFLADLAHRADDLSPGRAGAQLLLQSAVPHHGSILGAAVIAPDGRVLASTKDAEVGASVRSASWFRHALEDRAFTVGDLADEPAGHRNALHCAAPVLDSTGRVRAILSASLELDLLRRAATRARLPLHATFAILDQTGAVILRHPPAAASDADTSVTPFLARRSEWTQTVRARDGTVRIVAFAPLEGARSRSLYVGVGIERDAVLASASRSFWRALALMTLVGVLVALVAWRAARVIVLRRVDALLQATSHLRSGDLAARTGLDYGGGELSELSRAFDEMAEALQRQSLQRARTEERLRLSEARKSAVLQSSLDGILVLDVLGTVLERNAAARRMLGSNPDGVPSTLADLFLGPLPYDPARSGRREGRFEAIARRPDGSEFPADVSIAPIRDRDANGLYVATVHDITERKRWERELERLTFEDDLTGLYNRRGLTLFGAQQLKLAARNGQKIVVVSVDMDGLKAINDTFGHAEGDRAILELAGMIARSFRESDVLARPGGDEFVVLATETELGGAERSIARLAERITARNAAGDLGWTLSASMGWVRFDPRDHRPLEELVAAADTRMYEHKRGRRVGRGESRVGPRSPVPPRRAA